MLACLRMVLAHQGIHVTEASLLEHISLAEGGTHPDQLVRLAERHGLAAEARELNLAASEELVVQGRFPIVLMDRTVLDGEFVIHAVIPVRITRHYVTVLDPLRGERRLSVRKFAQTQRRVRWTVIWQPRE